MSWACGVIIFLDRHGSFWLVTSHMPENSGANRTLSPFFLPNHRNEAIFVVLMRAAKHEYIILIFLSILLLNILDDILFQTYHTLLFLHLTLPKGKLNSRKVRDLKNIVILLLLELIFLVHEWDNELDDLKEGIVLFDGVFVIESDFLLGGAGLLHEELCFLFRFH